MKLKPENIQALIFIYLFIFSGFNFTTAMINYKFISFSAAQIYMIFHVFICKNINRKQFDWVYLFGLITVGYRWFDLVDFVFPVISNSK